MADDFRLNIKAQVNIDDIKKQLKEVSKTEKITIDASGAQKATRSITKLKDELGNTYTATKKFDKEGNYVNTTLTTTSKVAKEATKEVKNVGTAVEDTSKKSQTFGERFETMGRKLQSINGIFQALKNAVVTFGQVMQPLLEFEDSLTEFKKVSDLSGEALDEYTKKLSQMGQEVGKSRAEMVDAATEFKKSGFDEADSAQLARIASLYQNIADEELSAGEAANFIISQMKAFNLTADDAMHIIDSVNEISNRTAVSSADLATNIGKASAALAVGGNTYEDVLSLMTAGVEITRSGSKVARALVSVQSRYNQTIDETSSTGQKLVKWYKEHNIAIKDSEGEQRKLYDTLTDVSKIWNQLSKDEQLYYLNIQAGANQTQNLSAILSNFTQVQEAHKIALDSDNSALDENARAMENLNKKIKAIKDSWAELILAVADSESIGNILDTVNNLLRSLAENEKAINTLVALAKVLLILKGLQIGGNLLGGLFTSFKNIVTIGGKTITTIKNVITLIKTLAGAQTVLTASQLGMVGALSAIAPYAAVFIGLGTAVGFASGKFQELYNQHIAETSDDLNKVADAYLNLVKAQKEFTHPGKGVGVKNVTGQEALDIQISKLQDLQKEYKSTNLSAQEFLDEIGDISSLTDYYNALQNIIDSGGELTQEQQNNYSALSSIVKAYNSATTEAERYNKALEIHKSNVNISTNIAYEFADSLVEVGGKYQFVSEAAKEAATKQLQTEIALTEATIKQVNARVSARIAEFGSIEAMLRDPSTNVAQLMQSDVGQQIRQYMSLKESLAEIQKMSAPSDTSGLDIKGRTGGGGGGGSDKKSKKDYLSTYKKQLESYQKTQEEAYKKGEITADQYYTNVRKKGEAYYKKLKAMGSDYTDDAKSMYEEYRKANTDAVNDIFDEIEYKYKEGTINGQKYYEQIWKYAKKFYKNGKLDFDSYRGYIKKGYETMFDSIKKQYESGQITAEQYMSKVKKAQSKASSSISSAAKSGNISGRTIVETRNALKIAAIEAKNAAAKALKEAAIEAAEAAVKAAEKKLEEAQKRQEKANTFISALQFWADEQTAAIDKTIDGYNAQIDALNEQLDLMDEQNDALDKQAERIKLVNALEEAKKQKTVRVYDSSLGWIWVSDPKKVKDAQTALDEFDTARKREEEQKAIQDQIKALEALIKEKEKEKQAYQDVIDEQTNALNRYNIEAELGMTIEQAIFEGRIANFENWKNAYINGTQEVIAAIGAVNSAQAELDAANAALDAANAMVVPEIKYGVTSKTGSVYEYTDDMSATERWNAAQTENVQTRKDQGYKVNTWYDSGGKLHYTAKSTKESKDYVRNNPEAVLKKATGAARNPPKNKKASGSLSLPSTGIYNVNELGDELMIPPTGNYDFLKKGTGIIPADLTQNLMDWGKFNPKNLIGAQPAITNNDHSITIQNLTVKSDNAKEFVRQLQNLAIVRS